MGKKVEFEVEKIQSSFDVTKAPLFKIVYFEFGPNFNPHLLIVFHHLIFDGVSWRILINDFFTLMQQYNQKADLNLGNKSTSYKRWSEELAKFAGNKNIDLDKLYWKNLLQYKEVHYPIDYSKGQNTYGSTEDITLSMDRDSTKFLLTQIPKKHGVSIFDILILALLEVLSSWSKSKRILLELEGHGREDIVNNIDLSRTIGWFTTIYPAVFEISDGDYTAKLSRINDTLKSIPNNGFDFSLLKYLNDDEDIKKILKQIPPAQINFNYLGQFDQTLSEMDFSFKMSSYSAGKEQDPNEIKSNLIHVVAVINGGQLHIRWLYSKNLFNSRTIKKLAKRYIKELKNIIEN